MSFNAKQFEDAVLESTRKQIEEQIRKMRCGTHGLASRIRLVRQGTSWSVQGVCCEDFQKVVFKHLQSK